MALPIAQMSADLAHIHSDVPHTFTFDSVDYTGSLGTTEIDVVFSEMGESDGVEVVLIATVSDFATLPADGDRITYEGTDYRVVSTRLDTAKVGISINLGSEYDKRSR
ncbi:MAG: hypothetical protein GY750_21005 [Lentisphaerae bacterium]|nr:hypothetical protein [Lentisphaerota bacterium]